MTTFRKKAKAALYKAGTISGKVKKYSQKGMADLDKENAAMATSVLSAIKSLGGKKAKKNAKAYKALSRHHSKMTPAQRRKVLKKHIIK